jgi:hypothetical protein
MLSDAEIVRQLTVIRHSPRAARYGRRITSINAIAVHAGVSTEYLYRIIRGERIGPHARVKLSRTLSCEPLSGARTAGHPLGDAALGPVFGVWPLRPLTENGNKTVS